jgi:hypothetical protein
MDGTFHPVASSINSTGTVQSGHGEQVENLGDVLPKSFPGWVEYVMDDANALVAMALAGISPPSCRGSPGNLLDDVLA